MMPIVLLLPNIMRLLPRCMDERQTAAVLDKMVLRWAAAYEWPQQWNA